MVYTVQKMIYATEPSLFERFMHCRDPKHAIVGYSWDGADEEKCQFTFSFGRTAMPRFMDLQLVSLMLGYSGFGLASLAKQVLGLDMRKARSVRPLLTPPQQLLFHSGNLLSPVPRILLLNTSCADCHKRLGSTAPHRCASAVCCTGRAHSWGSLQSSASLALVAVRVLRLQAASGRHPCSTGVAMQGSQMQKEVCQRKQPAVPFRHESS